MNEKTLMIFIQVMFTLIIGTIVNFFLELQIQFLGLLAFGLTQLYLQSQKISQPIIISIDGNIGSGKSTLMKILKEKFSYYTFVDEPVDKWLEAKDDNQKNLLTNFYEDRNRWSYTFQNYAFITRTKGLIDAVEKIKPKSISDYLNSVWQRIYYGRKLVIFTERSILTDRNVFAEMLHDGKDINSMEWTMYIDWYKLFEKTLNINHVVYLKTDPNTSLDRVNKRARDEEKTVALDYLESVHKKHEKWLANNSCALVLDGNSEFENNLEIQTDMLNNIMTQFKI